jgi:hypothetical protein
MDPPQVGRKRKNGLYQPTPGIVYEERLDNRPIPGFPKGLSQRTGLRSPDADVLFQSRREGA